MPRGTSRGSMREQRGEVARRPRRARRRNVARPRPAPPCNARSRRGEPGAARRRADSRSAHGQLPVSKVIVSASESLRPRVEQGRRTHRSCRPPSIARFRRPPARGTSRSRSARGRAWRRRSRCHPPSAELQLDDARAERGAFVDGLRERVAIERAVGREERRGRREDGPQSELRESARRVRAARRRGVGFVREQFATHFESLRACTGSAPPPRTRGRRGGSPPRRTRWRRSPLQPVDSNLRSFT